MAERACGSGGRLFGGGRLAPGPDVRACCGTGLVIATPSVVWQLGVGTFYCQRYGAAAPVAVGLLEIASLSLLFATALSDPGIVPRQKDFAEQHDAATKTTRAKQPQRYYDLVLRGHPFKLKFCSTCNIYRPPRCTHCSVCENCVERFDHHCPWIGNCVGKRNYRLFFSFVLTTASLNAVSLVSAVAQLAITCVELQQRRGLSGSEAFLEGLRQEVMACLVAVFCLLPIWFTVGLCIYHHYLVCLNQTTYEQIKGLYSDGANPFDRGGPAANCRDVLGAGLWARPLGAGLARLLRPRTPRNAEPEIKLQSGPAAWRPWRRRGR